MPNNDAPICPIFSKLRPYLDEAWEAVPDGEDCIFPEVAGSDQNHRTWLKRLIAQSGLDVWPKLWQNMRASAATDLVEEYPEHVVNSWLGHTERIAQRHYQMSTEEHFNKARSPVSRKLLVALQHRQFSEHAFLDR